MAHKLKFALPVLVATPVDVGRLLREVRLIDETLLQLKLRKTGEEIKMPKTTHLMEQMVELNKLNLLQEEDRKELQEFLTAVREQAPVFHMSFSADPSVSFMEKLTSWLRREVSPHVLITIGLQPTIGAGCVLRTANRQIDMSLRQDFANKRDLLKEKLQPDKASA